LILERASGYVGCLVKEVIEMHLNKCNFNKECGFILSHALSPVTEVLMDVKAGPLAAGAWLPPPTLLSPHQL
jgi:hypothetical protein